MGTAVADVGSRGLASLNLSFPGTLAGPLTLGQPDARVHGLCCVIARPAHPELNPCWKTQALVTVAPQH